MTRRIMAHVMAGATLSSAALIAFRADAAPVLEAVIEGDVVYRAASTR